MLPWDDSTMIALSPEMLETHCMNVSRMCLFLMLAVSFTRIEAIEIVDIFSDHMVLQRDMPIRVWGNGEPDSKVTVKLGAHRQVTEVNTQGTWSLNLPAMSASDEPRTLHVASGGDVVAVTDVLVGEVWHASGQSNMEWSLGASAKKLPAISKLLDAADYPGMRYRAIKTRERDKAASRIGDGGSWQVCTPESAQTFSAVAILFARKIHLELGVPVGVIETSWGGHPIEPFIPESAFVGHPVLEKERQLGRQKDMTGLRHMTGGVWARNASWLPGWIYNARIAPFAGYSLRGVIWYQAESNCGTGEDPRFYSEKMKALVRGWRSAWERPEMPVYYVQLPQYTSPGWTRMRDEQRRAMSEPNTGMAVIIDLALDDIHPANKLDVAERLALWPLGNAYGRDISVSGPLFESVSFQGSYATVRFDHVDRGLVTGSKTDLQPTVIHEGKEVSGFELAGNDGIWLTASAVIDADVVRCKADRVKDPVAVRYGYATHMPSERPWNLYNRAGLPASPFIAGALGYRPKAIDASGLTR
jgi:sialate O-acetylesterase